MIYIILGLLTIILTSFASDEDSISLNLRMSASLILDDTLLQYHHEENEQSLKIEKLQIDVKSIEKQWIASRNELKENEGKADFNPLYLYKSASLWEKFNAYRIDLQNARQLRFFYEYLTNIRTDYLTLAKKGDLQKNIRNLKDSLEQFQIIIQQNKRWAFENTKEIDSNRAELAATLGNKKDSISPDIQRQLRKKNEYIDLQVNSFNTFILKCDLLNTHLNNYLESIKLWQERIPASLKIKKKIFQILSLWSFEIKRIDGKSLTIGKIITALLIIILGLKIAQKASLISAKILVQKFHIEPGAADAGQKLFFYISFIFFFLIALYSIKVPLTAFTFVGGALALGIGFGSQNILNNFISSIILLLERPIKKGDFIEIDSIVGCVDSIGLRSTLIKTASNMHLVIPNSSLVEKNVINWTLSDRLIRLELRVGVAYGSSTEKVTEILNTVLAENISVLQSPEPLIMFSDFGDNALQFDLLFWIKMSHIIQQRTILSQLRYAIDDKFRRASVTIAFPQRDIHFDAVQPLRIQFEKQKNNI